MISRKTTPSGASYGGLASKRSSLYHRVLVNEHQPGTSHASVPEMSSQARAAYQALLGGIVEEGSSSAGSQKEEKEEVDAQSLLSDDDEPFIIEEAIVVKIARYKACDVETVTKKKNTNV